MTWLLVIAGLGCCLQASEVPVNAESVLLPWPAPEGRKAAKVDPWLSYDKVQHLTFSFLWTLSSQYALEQKAGWPPGRAWPLAAGTAAAAGLVKELYDWKVGPSRHFSYRDLVADGLGIALAVGVIFL